MALTSRRRQRVRALLIHLAFLAGTANADVVSSFYWGFKTLTTTSLPECGRVQLFLNSSGASTNAIPPYTFIAYEAAGIPTVQTLGSDPNNLWWTVDHQSQTQLILSMADASGNAGGVAPNLYTVIPSSFGTSCHAQNPTSPVSITTNTTKSISSCDILPLKMAGGTKPYTISVASLGASVATNFTLGSAFDTYNWVNRASPDSKIIAAVSDANGVYAPSTNLLSTSGSTDLTCGNRQSTEIDSTGQSSSVQVGGATATSTSQPSSSSSSATSSPSMTTIIASVVGGAVLLGAVAMGAFFFLKKRRVKARDPRGYSDDAYGGLGLGKVGGPGHVQNASFVEEAAPFVAPVGLGVPYTDDPYRRSSFPSQSQYSPAPSEGMYGPRMQARASTHTVANLPPEIMSYATQQNGAPSSPINAIPPQVTGPGAPRALMTISPLPVSSSNPYRSSTGLTVVSSAAPPSPTESSSGISAALAGPSTGVLYAVNNVSASGWDARMPMNEAGPSMSRTVVAEPLPIQQSTDTKQGAAQPRQQSVVYQHEDVADVVDELPPAYKERTDIDH